MNAKELILLDGVESDLMRISTGSDGSKTITNHLAFFGETVALVEWNSLTYMFLSTLNSVAPLAVFAPYVVVSDPTPDSCFSPACYAQATATGADDRGRWVKLTIWRMIRTLLSSETQGAGPRRFSSRLE